MNFYLFGPVIGNMFLVLLFFQAFLNPLANKMFIENTSSIYFMTELFSLAACLVLLKFKLHPQELGIVINNNTSNQLINQIRYFSIVVFFIIGTLLIGYITHDWAIPLVFSLSLISKAYAKNFVSSEKKVTIYAIIFGLSYLLVFFSAVIWGIFYYGSLALIELYSSFIYIKTLRLKAKSV